MSLRSRRFVPPQSLYARGLVYMALIPGNDEAETLRSEDIRDIPEWDRCLDERKPGEPGVNIIIKPIRVRGGTCEFSPLDPPTFCFSLSPANMAKYLLMEVAEERPRRTKRKSAK